MSAATARPRTPGNVERCARAQQRPTAAEEVEFTAIDGVEGVLATAETTLSAGGERFGSTVSVLYGDGAYKLFRVEATGPVE